MVSSHYTHFKEKSCRVRLTNEPTAAPAGGWKKSAPREKTERADISSDLRDMPASPGSPSRRPFCSRDSLLGIPAPPGSASWGPLYSRDSLRSIPAPLGRASGASLYPPGEAPGSPPHPTLPEGARKLLPRGCTGAGQGAALTPAPAAPLPRLARPAPPRARRCLRRSLPRQAPHVGAPHRAPSAGGSRPRVPARPRSSSGGGGGGSRPPPAGGCPPEAPPRRGPSAGDAAARSPPAPLSAARRGRAGGRPRSMAKAPGRRLGVAWP